MGDIDQTGRSQVPVRANFPRQGLHSVPLRRATNTGCGARIRRRFLLAGVLHRGGGLPLADDRNASLRGPHINDLHNGDFRLVFLMSDGTGRAAGCSWLKSPSMAAFSCGRRPAQGGGAGVVSRPHFTFSPHGFRLNAPRKTCVLNPGITGSLSKPNQPPDALRTGNH
jgi:hypothetical protein